MAASLCDQLPSHAAPALTSLQNVLDAVQLNASPDECHRFAADPSGRLHTKDLYSWLSHGPHEASPIPSFIWGSNAPPHVKFFLLASLAGQAPDTG